MAKISIKLASKGLTSFDLSSNHITTTDFGQLQVSHFLPVVPNDKITCNLGSEARFAPMVVPTFMDVELVTRAFYVPMSAIYQPFEYFYTDRQDSSVFKQLPYITNADFVHFLTSASYDYTRDVPSDVQCDFILGGDRFIFTERGRLAMKLFQSLGYSFNWTMSDTTPMSLLPLLAFMRVCYDYVYPSQYLDGLGLTKYFKISSSADLSNCLGTTSLIYSFLASCIALLHLPYRQDYFTAAWRNLNAPGTSVQSISATSPDGNSTIESAQGNVNTSIASSKVSQYALNLLSRMYDFVTRNNIVGVRYADQLFARFGIGSRRSDPDMSQFIGQHVQNINVVDVTAMTAAQGQDLGDLGGKAYLQGRGHLYSFDSVDEFGYIVCLSYLMPKQGYYQGRKRWVTQFGRFDFYTPEFDMQMRAIRNDEVFADYRLDTDYTAGQTYGGNPANKFGHAPNYSELKKGDDYLTGDFRVPSLKRNLDSYYLLRDIPMPSSENPLALNADFLFMQQHEYDKIFAQMYSLRAPVGFDIPTIDAPEDSYLCVGGKLAVALLDPNDPDDGGFIIVSNFESDLLRVLFRSRADIEAIGVDLDDISTYYSVTTDTVTISGTSNVIYLDLYGSGFVMKKGGNYIVTSTVLSESDVITTYIYPSLTECHTQSAFMALYQDYIDHVYLKHRFDIKATRSMVPISQEFMIADGGNVASVDMNGNRIS